MKKRYLVLLLFIFVSILLSACGRYGWFNTHYETRLNVSRGAANPCSKGLQARLTVLSTGETIISDKLVSPNGEFLLSENQFTSLHRNGEKMRLEAYCYEADDKQGWLVVEGIGIGASHKTPTRLFSVSLPNPNDASCLRKSDEASSEITIVKFVEPVPCVPKNDFIPRR